LFIINLFIKNYISVYKLRILYCYLVQSSYLYFLSQQHNPLVFLKNCAPYYNHIYYRCHNINLSQTFYSHSQQIFYFKFTQSFLDLVLFPPSTVRVQHHVMPICSGLLLDVEHYLLLHISGFQLLQVVYSSHHFRC
jgi:hypothetical protein